MQCVLLSGGRAKCIWHYLHASELACWDHLSRIGSLLFVLVLKNLGSRDKDGDNTNSIKILHRGNTQMHLVSFTPRLRHRNEFRIPRNESLTILSSSHGNKDEETGQYSFNVKNLLKYEQDVPDKIPNWPGSPDNGEPKYIEPISDYSRTDDDFIPFTMWKLSGVTDIGYVVLAFTIEFNELTYNEFFEKTGHFTIDGSKPLLGRLRGTDLNRFPEEREKWEKGLNDFSKRLLIPDSQEVFFLDNVSPVEVDDSSLYGIEKAHQQPDSQLQTQRYVALHSSFSMSTSITDEGARSYTEPQDNKSESKLSLLR
jgi:hypothetical protein